MARNCVISGDYLNSRFVKSKDGLVIAASLLDKVTLNQSTVSYYEVLSEKSKTSSASAVTRGGLGIALLGPIGGFAALGAKQKGTHIVAVQFYDGKKSLLELDDSLYQELIKHLFMSSGPETGAVPVPETGYAPFSNNAYSKAEEYRLFQQKLEQQKKRQRKKNIVIILAVFCFMALVATKASISANKDNNPASAPDATIQQTNEPKPSIE